MKHALATLCLTLLAGILPAFAAPPTTITYQGYLTGSNSAPLNAPVAMTLSLYSAPTGGAALWSEHQTAVPVVNGVYSIMMGSITPIALPFDTVYYLGVAVGSDPEMTPRQELSSVPYAFRAIGADKLNQVCGDGEMLKYSTASSSWSCAAGSLIASGTLAVANGGTGGTDAATARSNLGLSAVANSGSYTDLINTPTFGALAAKATVDLAADVTGVLPAAKLPVMAGDSGAGGTAGAVPAPAAGTAAAGKFLKANGTWATPPRWPWFAVTGTTQQAAPNSAYLVSNAYPGNNDLCDPKLCAPATCDPFIANPTSCNPVIYAPDKCDPAVCTVPGTCLIDECTADINICGPAGTCDPGACVPNPVTCAPAVACAPAMCTPTTIVMPLSADLAIGDSVKIMAKSGRWTVGVNFGQQFVMPGDIAGTPDVFDFDALIEGTFVPAGISSEFIYIGDNQFMFPFDLSALIAAGNK